MNLSCPECGSERLRRSYQLSVQEECKVEARSGRLEILRNGPSSIDLSEPEAERFYCAVCSANLGGRSRLRATLAGEYGTPPLADPASPRGPRSPREPGRDTKPGSKGAPPFGVSSEEAKKVLDEVGDMVPKEWQQSPVFRGVMRGLKKGVERLDDMGK